MSQLGHYWKAILGFVTPGLVILGTSITAGSDGGTRVTSTEWVTIAIACVATGGLVAAKANTPTPVVHRRPRRHRQPVNPAPIGPVDPPNESG